jgi:hypothetical protein
VKIDAELAGFLASPVMIIMGTCGDGNRPDIGRAVGASIDGETGRMRLVLSSWQWPRTVENLRKSGRAAVTFARPSDYVSYQVKGSATVQPPDPKDVAQSERYVAAILEVLTALGLDRRLALPWLGNRDLVVIAIDVEAVYVQTPGPKAGRQLPVPHA